MSAMKAFRHLIGAVTLVAGIAGGIYLWSLVEGAADPNEFQLTLLFEGAEGLAPGAAIRYRGVPVGEVRRISLGPGGGNAEVVCALQASAQHTLLTTSRFWVVRPRFTGISEGATGLETMIKDSYITYSNPPTPAPRLEPGAQVLGLSAPPKPGNSFLVGQTEPGDLIIEVYFADVGGLRKGAPVRHRGLPVGTVTNVALTRNAEAVVVSARIRKAYRVAVRDGTQFWVARPELSARWLSGIAVEDIETIVEGASLAFHTPSDDTSPPAADNARFRGSLRRPDIDERLDALPESGAPKRSEIVNSLRQSIVAVHLSFEERDWFSPNDDYRVQAPGVAYRTQDGLTICLVAQAAVDPKLIASESNPKIRGERIRTKLADGSVHDSARIWTDPDGRGLSIVQIRGADAALATTPPVSFGGFAAAIGREVTLLGLDDDSAIVERRTTLGAGGTIAGASNFELIVFEEQVVGVCRSTAEGNTQVVSFEWIPNSLRPVLPPADQR